jgi:hypothetical protein
MFGRHRNQGAKRPTGEQEMPVEIHLENDVATVEHAVEAYLENSTDGQRKDLLAALERLDDQITLSDAYESRWRSIYAVGTSHTVVGETGPNSIAEEVPSPEFSAQVALVKAAKEEVRGPSPQTLADLRTASAALASVRAQDQAARPPSG